MNDTEAHFKDWLNGPAGGEWRRLDEPPAIPSDVTNPFRDVGEWWAGVPNTDHVLYACVAGDAGTKGVYLVIVYCTTVSAAPPRFPTYEEISAVLDRACLEGAIITLQTVTGGGLIEPPSGCRALTLIGTGAYIEGTDAAIRAQLAAPAARTNGGAHG
jgi:hypothetical protein